MIHPSIGRSVSSSSFFAITANPSNPPLVSIPQTFLPDKKTNIANPARWNPSREQPPSVAPHPALCLDGLSHTRTLIQPNGRYSSTCISTAPRERCVRARGREHHPSRPSGLSASQSHQLTGLARARKANVSSPLAAAAAAFLSAVRTSTLIWLGKGPSCGANVSCRFPSLSLLSIVRSVHNPFLTVRPFCSLAFQTFCARRVTVSTSSVVPSLALAGRSTTTLTAIEIIIHSRRWQSSDPTFPTTR